MVKRVKSVAGSFRRCTAAISVRVTGTDRVEYLWPGLEVNLDRELAPGFTLRDAVAGREECFEFVGTTDGATDSESGGTLPVEGVEPDA